MNKYILNPFLPSVMEKGQSIAIGFFDGMHLGHLSLLEEITKRQESPSILTFDLGMKNKLGGNKSGLLLTQKEKDECLERLGVKNEYILPFDERIMNLSKQEFLDFLARLSPKRIVVGKDFTFGRNAGGKSNDLFTLEKNGISIHVVNLKKNKDEKVSSSNIKNKLRNKEIQEANNMLGYPFFIKARVVHGLENGRKIDFPTANMIYPDEKVKLPCGVYKTMTELDGKKYLSMTNIGTHPSINELKEDIIETNLFDFDDNIYGKTIQVNFLEFIREQKKFNDIIELKKQLENDRKTIMDKD
jgi:riboflavin kinase / FMN adenylyltransferase